MKNKEDFLNKIIDDLQMAEYRSQMTKDEWKGWFEDAYNEGYKQAQALQLQQTGVSGSTYFNNYILLKMKNLTDEELEKLLLDTDSFYDCTTEEDKQRIRNSYRKVESETNKQIEEAGGVIKWYESGRGRVIDFD